MEDESMRDRFLMRPSIARMTLDLDYGDMGMDHSTMGNRPSAGAKTVEALQTRLQELLVFEIRQDGDTQIKSLSVRSLYKYVLKAIKVSAEKRRAIRGNSDASLGRIRENIPTNNTSIDSKNTNESEGNKKNDEDGHRDASNSTNNSDSDNDKINELVGGMQTPTRPSTSNAASTTSRVSFGGPEGPVITEHPPPPPRDSRASATTNATTGDHPNHSGRVTYRERLGGFLHPRDMRRLVTPFSASNEPELIVRRHVMLLNFDPLRAVILRDRLLVLVPDGADSLLQDLEKRVRGGTREAERDIFGESTVANSQAESSNIDDSLHSLSNVSLSLASENGKTDGADQKKKHHPFNPNSLLKKAAKKVVHPKKGHASEHLENSKGSPYASSDDLTVDTHFDDVGSEFREWEEMEGRDWIDLPFELQCLDAVLGSVAAILANDTAELKITFMGAMNRLLHKGSSHGDEILRHMKNSIGEMTSRVKGFIRAMNLVLDETEDMALMNLSRLLTHPERFIQPVDEAIMDEGVCNVSSFLLCGLFAYCIFSALLHLYFCACFQNLTSLNLF